MPVPPLLTSALSDLDHCLTPKVDCFIPCAIDHLCQLAAKSVDLFSKYRVHKTGNKRTSDEHPVQTRGDIKTRNT